MQNMLRRRTVDELLDACELRGRRRLGRVEIEAQALEVHQRAGLGDVAADDLLERSLQQVCGGVVAASLAPRGGSGEYGSATP